LLQPFLIPSWDSGRSMVRREPWWGKGKVVTQDRLFCTLKHASNVKLLEAPITTWREARRAPSTPEKQGSQPLGLLVMFWMFGATRMF
jgi:hypothetical protein